VEAPTEHRDVDEAEQQHRHLELERRIAHHGIASAASNTIPDAICNTSRTPRPA